MNYQEAIKKTNTNIENLIDIMNFLDNKLEELGKRLDLDKAELGKINTSDTYLLEEVKKGIINLVYELQLLERLVSNYEDLKENGNI